ncbi:MAG: glucose-1-phosphate thymidylyltransferase [Dehalococcoidia bacterium]
MKGLVLAGGKGSRLRPFTYTGPKQLVPIANKPVLFYALDQLVDAGITEIGVVVGDTASQIEEATGDGARFGARITYIHQPEPLGIAHGILVARAFLADDPFVLILGDNFLREGIRLLVEQFSLGVTNCQILLQAVPRPEELGVAVLQDGRVVRLVEKPRRWISNLAVIGIYFFDRHVHRAVRAIQPSPRGELEITDTLQYLIDAGYHVGHIQLEGCWIDTGRVGDILAANRAVLEVAEARIDGHVDAQSELQGIVIVEAGAEVRASTIEGPAIIGSGTLVERAYIGPFTSIDHDCLLRDSQIAGSVVLDNTSIDRVPQRIEGSLIGRRVKLEGLSRPPKAYRLVLGDFSEAGLP